MNIAPDTIEPYLGYKALTCLDGELYSPSYRVPWPKQQKLEAACAVFAGDHWAPPQNHQIGGDTCHCGIYAVNTPEACSSYIQPPASVICKVALWGTTTVGVNGVRAQYAYPQTIEYVMGLNNEQITRLADEYGLTLPEGTPPDASELIEHYLISMSTTTTTVAMSSTVVPLTIWLSNNNTTNDISWTTTTGQNT